MHKLKKIQRKVIPPGGVTLIELMLAITILGVIAAFTLPVYQNYRERVRIAQASTDIAVIASKINAYHLDQNEYPDSLAIIVAGAQLDPWGRPYEYLNLDKNGNGGARRDRNLNPLNSDFDLYSRGKDGNTKLPITQKDSLDDVLRANDGAFINLASKY